MNWYADIIIDIAHSRLDQTFQYRVPEELAETLEPGNVVLVPFGRGDHPKKGYVLRITDHAACAPEKLKTILQVETSLAGAESKLTALALWMRDYYGSTAVQALRTVLPFREQAAPKKKRKLVLRLPAGEAQEVLARCREKHQTARARLLEALLAEPALPMEIVTGSLKITPSVWKPLAEQGIVACETEQIYRTPAVLRQLQEESRRSAAVGRQDADGGKAATGRQDADGSKAAADEHNAGGFRLNAAQQAAVDAVCSRWESGSGRYLLHGVTGSGKTAVYMELIACALKRGQQAILLIPEISLTYQNVIRFYHRFGDRISILHSRLSQAERYDQFERARDGDIDVMIGPRSALFAPFPRLGIIIIDEEHEPSYKSETVPRYHAREVARKRAELEGAQLVLGSATPSLEAYYGAQTGLYELLRLPDRATGGQLPTVYTVDLRAELKEGNHSILSRTLYEKLSGVLAEKKQAMLFLNRRGYMGFVSCRSCGAVLKCPHCDVSLSLHRGGRMVCHYCGYEEQAAKHCPVCGSPYIGGFRAGTQQIEEVVKGMFPEARILRMDADTTRGKDGHAEILRAFGSHEADILIGTQMIVKGHDFPGVTLVGILAADLSLHVSDYRAAERTYQLLTQAAGRAGRGREPGEVVIQTYDPEHYAVVCAARQDYEPFYEQELAYRRLSGYPPTGNLLAVHLAAPDEEKLAVAVDYLARFIRQIAGKYQALVIGPADEPIAKINDVYRKAVYVKQADTRRLIGVKNMVEQYIEINSGFSDIRVQFEMN